MLAVAEVAAMRAVYTDITEAAVSDLLAEWRLFDLSDAAHTSAQTRELLPLLIGDYGEGLGAVSADWYEELRLDAVSPRRPAYSAIVADGPKASQIDALVGWGTAPLHWENVDHALALSRIVGGLQRHLTTVGRRTIDENAQRDPLQVTRARQAAPKACAFCAMLATRDDYSDASFKNSDARFTGSGKVKVHDYCRCVLVPVFPGVELERPPYYDAYADAYERAFKAGSGLTGPAKNRAILAAMREILGSH